MSLPTINKSVSTSCIGLYFWSLNDVLDKLIPGVKHKQFPSFNLFWVIKPSTFLGFCCASATAQGSWLYFFRYKKNIQGRDKSQYVHGLINTTILVALSYKTLYDVYRTNSIFYLLLYIPYFLWIQFANILNIQLVFGKTKWFIFICIGNATKQNWGLSSFFIG